MQDEVGPELAAEFIGRLIVACVELQPSEDVLQIPSVWHTTQDGICDLDNAEFKVANVRLRLW